MKKLLCILSALLLLCSPLAAAETYSDEMGYQIDFPDDNWLVLPEEALALFFDGQTTFEEEIDGVKISVTLELLAMSMEGETGIFVLGMASGGIDLSSVIDSLIEEMDMPELFLSEDGVQIEELQKEEIDFLGEKVTCVHLVARVEGVEGFVYYDYVPYIKGEKLDMIMLFSTDKGELAALYGLFSSMEKGPERSRPAETPAPTAKPSGNAA